MDYWLDIFFIAQKNQLSLLNDTLNLYKKLSVEDYIFFTDKIEKKSKSRIKIIIKYIISSIPTPYCILLGGIRKKRDKIYHIITIEKLKRIKWTYNKKFKEDFFSDIKKYLAKETFQDLSTTLSDKFFMNSINTKGIPRFFYGAPDNLYKEEFVKLLFLNKKINFIGIQHGGCSLEYAKNRFDKYDQSITDKMLYWGLGVNNIRQNRFKLDPTSFGRIKRCFLIESLEPNIILKEFFNGSEQIYKDSKKKRTGLRDSLNKYNFGMIKHPRSKKNNYNEYESTVRMSDLSLFEQKRSIFILDTPFQTFMYKSIYENIPFLMFISRDWHKWFTPKYSSFLEFLKSLNVLFYWDQENEFFNYIKDVLYSSKMKNKNNNIIIKYLESNP